MTSGATRLNKTRRFGASVASVLTLGGFYGSLPVATGTDAWSSMSGLPFGRQQSWLGWW